MHRECRGGDMEGRKNGGMRDECVEGEGMEESNRQ